MIGEFPGLAKLDSDGNLRATSDFRGLYGALLEQWLGTDADGDHPGRRASSPARRSCGDRHRARVADARVAARGVQVGADEFSYSLSRQSIKAGPAIVQLVNYGEDEHDLRLRRAGGTRTYRIGKVRPGGLGELEARFLPGGSRSGARSPTTASAE